MKLQITIEEFGTLVRARRNALGWTQECLAAEALNNSERKGYISQVENGRLANITAITVQKITNALNFSREQIDEMLGVVAPEPTRTHDNASSPKNLDHALHRIDSQGHEYSWYDLDFSANTGWMGLQEDIETVLAHGMRDRCYISDEKFFRLATILLELSWATDYPQRANARARNYYDFMKSERQDLESEAHRHLYLHNTIDRPNYEVRFALRETPYPSSVTENFEFHAEQCDEALQVLRGASEGIEGWPESIEDMISYQITNVIKTTIFRPMHSLGREIDHLLGCQRDLSVSEDGFSRDLFASELAITALTGRDSDIIDLLLSYRNIILPLKSSYCLSILASIDLNLITFGIIDPADAHTYGFFEMNINQQQRFIQINRAYLLPRTLRYVVDKSAPVTAFEAARLARTISREIGDR